MAEKSPNGVPEAEDKYLPMWVIVAMSISVLVLTVPMMTSIKNICELPGRCFDAKAVQASIVTEARAAEVAKAVAEARVAEVLAAKSAPSAPSAGASK